ncbi:patatin-like phospholipase family protein [Serpentinicella sp. ANB-PHB4]|uniref:patatin-like phospholipase family protein n=1 Tax=Serpentinicella sp. ANB-PHB4 TaxID=3074076 RepID=UPI002857FEF8|nr:patatin-like phospholipase family protein [Serpentinicella sp. ANB-PHB4]MDR5658390.1 patatin-like phospholipase family protein [Serpentinicella sp. ANB-PHB4]
MKRFGIALGGGGSRGFAHLGVIKALEEKGIKPEIFSGTSAGAIVAALLAAQKTPDDIMEIMKDIKITDAAKIKFPVNGFANLDTLGNQLDKILKGKNFTDLKYPLYICASNINTGKVEYINSGNVAKAVQASSSIPILFSPVEIKGQSYVDGGLLDNVPVKPLMNKCEKIITIDIMPVVKTEKINGILEITKRIFQMNVGKQQEKKENSDLFIKLEALVDYNILDTSQNEKIFEIGYNYTKNLDITKVQID